MAEKAVSSESGSKVTSEVKKRQKHQHDQKKKAMKNKIKKLQQLEDEKEAKIEENTKKIVEQTRKISESTSNMTKVTKSHNHQKEVNKYATCQRLLLEEPSFFDMTTICSSSSMSTTTTSVTSKTSSGTLSPQSATCQMCYSQNPSCSGGSSNAGISVVSFSVDTQGEADELVQQLMDENMVADVNFLSAMVNRKFSIYGQVTSDPS